MYWPSSYLILRYKVNHFNLSLPTKLGITSLTVYCKYFDIMGPFEPACSWGNIHPLWWMTHMLTILQSWICLEIGGWEMGLYGYVWIEVYFGTLNANVYLKSLNSLSNTYLWIQPKHIFMDTTHKTTKILTLMSQHNWRRRQQCSNAWVRCIFGS